ncbi:MAG: extracellular solute-binding protein [Lachnospiraceae bacterium]|nr:extracellular solute-binding protein [Lachnospiraceae bacterium]
MRKRVFRFKVLLASGVLLCMAALSGCHGSKGLPAFVLPEEFDMTKEYDIVFWAKNDTNMVQTRIYEQAIADFEALYPNVDVTLRLYTNYGDIYKDVITNLATATTPNVCISYPDHVATYLTGMNQVVSMDELFTSSTFGFGGTQVKFDGPSQEELVAKFLEEGKFNGHYYTMPFMRSSEACYVNKTYVEELGYTLPETLTWDFVWEVSEAAMAKDADGKFRINGQEVMIPFIYKSVDNMMIQMLRQQGAVYSDDKGNIGLFHETTKEILYDVAEHAGTGAFSTFNIVSYPGNKFNAGQCIFAVDSTAGATWMGPYAPLQEIDEDKLIPFETAVMAIPQYDPEHPQMISQGPSICIFNKEDPQEVVASWLFVQYLLTNEVQIAYSQTEGYVPVTTKALEAEEYQDYLSRMGEDNDLYYDVKIKAAKLVLDNIENTFVTPVFNGSASLRDASGQLINNAARASGRKQTVDDKFMETQFDSVTTLFGLDKLNTRLGATEFEELPTTAVLLLASLGTAWVLILCYVVLQKVKSTRKKK